jgi:plastocyanin
MATLILVFGLAGSVHAAGAVVTINDFSFGPSPVTITAGDTVTWVNRGAVPHWVTPGVGPNGGGGFAASPKIPVGGRYTATFSAVGTFVYHDALYPFMTGTVVVKRGLAPTPKPTARPTPRPTSAPAVNPTAKQTARPTAKPTSKPAATVAPGASGAPPASGSPGASGAPGSPTQSAGIGGAPGSGTAGSGTPGQASQSSSGLGDLGTAILILVIIALVVLAFFGGRASRMFTRDRE